MEFLRQHGGRVLENVLAWDCEADYYELVAKLQDGGARRPEAEFRAYVQCRQMFAPALRKPDVDPAEIEGQALDFEISGLLSDINSQL